ncbi:cell envelope integrity EipB family protein [Azospirillum sp. SYSU D00513]|uniref:cell envelope integrity EipB family protein n=1 Tax=Azospirillum sp. SYSU D00513 TaxID=2812561 RepID=UPI0032B43AC3
MALPNRRSAARLAASLAIGTLLTTAMAPAVPSPALAAGPAAGGIQPHRAVYAMSLMSARNGSNVSNVSGQMSFEWDDACDGWTTEQRFQLRFAYAEGEEMNMTTHYVTWEAKDGSRYRFNVRKTMNGEGDEEVSGTAQLSKDGTGKAAFTKPEAKQIPLPAGTMFPSAHTLAILDKAQEGENFFTRTIFDGAEDEGVTEVSAVIGKPAQPNQTTRDKAGNALKLDGQTSLPVRMAFFPSDSDSAQPEYEMGLHLLRNGIAESMQIDYGDFAVKGVLESLEPLPRTGC